MRLCLFVQFLYGYGYYYVNVGGEGQQVGNCLVGEFGIDMFFKYIGDGID